MSSQRKGRNCVLDPPHLDAILYPHSRIANCTAGCSGASCPSEPDEWGGKPREPVTVMPPLPRTRGGRRMSRTSVSAGAGENRQYRGPASEAADFREQPDHASETRSRRNASDSILGAAGVLPFPFGVGNVRNATMPPARKRAPHRRGARKQGTRKRKETSYMKSRAKP